MKLPVNYQNENELRAAFSWITRTGAGVKFGSRPIAWYQMHQCAALDELTRLCGCEGETTIRLRGTIFQSQMNGNSRWHNIISVDELYRRADAKARA